MTVEISADDCLHVIQVIKADGKNVCVCFCLCVHMVLNLQSFVDLSPDERVSFVL